MSPRPPACVLWPVGAACAVLALIFGFVARGRTDRIGSGDGMALAGVVLGFMTLGLIVAILIVASLVPEMAWPQYW